jgi:hypothetical protein
VQGSGFKVWGFRGLGSGSGCRVKDAGFMVLWFQV